jgi:hypothetical protein
MSASRQGLTGFRFASTIHFVENGKRDTVGVSTQIKNPTHHGEPFGQLSVSHDGL